MRKWVEKEKCVGIIRDKEAMKKEKKIKRNELVL